MIAILFRDIWTIMGTIVLTYLFLYFVINMIIRIWSRYMRMCVVKKHGWPPSHLDADGDFIQPENK